MENTKACICCGVTYEISNWDFYSLCNQCFNQFDNQKMRGRFSYLCNGPEEGQFYTESPAEYVKAQICTHNEGNNNMKKFLGHLEEKFKVSDHVEVDKNCYP
jgi:hypothetical protein